LPARRARDAQFSESHWSSAARRKAAIWFSLRGSQRAHPPACRALIQLLA